MSARLRLLAAPKTLPRRSPQQRAPRSRPLPPAKSFCVLNCSSLFRRASHGSERQSTCRCNASIAVSSMRAPRWRAVVFEATSHMPGGLCHMSAVRLFGARKVASSVSYCERLRGSQKARKAVGRRPCWHSGACDLSRGCRACQACRQMSGYVGIVGMSYGINVGPVKARQGGEGRV